MDKKLLSDLLFIPVMTTGIGDGLAEPVGIAWGKHKYKTRGLCSPKLYTRSYEGSFTVYISCVITTAAVYSTVRERAAILSARS